MKKRACNACRKAHTKCDGNRPCSSCKAKHKVCIEFDHTREGVAHEELVSQIQQLQEENQLLREQNKQLQTSVVGQQDSFPPHSQRLYPRNEIELCLWDPPCKTACALYDASGMRLLGCNEAFRRLTSLSVEQLKSGISLFDFIPERLKFSWVLMNQWLSGSSIQSIKCSSPLRFLGGEAIVNLTAHMEHSFQWIEYEVTDSFNDAFQVDKIHLPKTFDVPSRVALDNGFVLPPYSFARLLDVYARSCRGMDGNLAIKQFEALEELKKTLSHQPAPLPVIPESKFYDADENCVIDGEINLVNPPTTTTPQLKQLNLPNTTTSNNIIRFTPITLNVHELEMIARRTLIGHSHNYSNS